jgi:hypothetical protein
MKKFILAVVLIVVSTAAYSQTFDGFLDGAGLGPVNDIVDFYKEKGYREVKNNSSLVFLFGHIGRMEVVVMIERKDSDTTYIDEITMFYPPIKNIEENFCEHKEKFAENFGYPTGVEKDKCYWSGLGTDDQDNLVYTIGVEEGHIYHSLQRKN